MGTPSFGLHDRIVVVTGAAQGIGAACARRLAHDGAAVALWDVDLAPAQALADELRAAGAEACAQRCDVARKAEVDAALAATEQALGRVNALVNNAGIFRAADFLDISEVDWDAVIGSDEARERILSRTPLRRLGEPSEIADVVAFLLSDAASYVTGEIVRRRRAPRAELHHAAEGLTPKDSGRCRGAHRRGCELPAERLGCWRRLS